MEIIIIKPLVVWKIKSVYRDVKWCFNPFKPEFTIVISIHYKPEKCCRNSPPVVNEDDLKWWQMKKIYRF